MRQPRCADVEKQQTHVEKRQEFVAEKKQKVGMQRAIVAENLRAIAAAAG